MSCKKKSNDVSSSSGTSTGAGQDTYVLLLESNFYRSKISVENISDNVLIKRYNNSGDSTKNCPISYTFKGSSENKYRIYTTSVKNSTDTALYMTNTGLTYNYLQVKKNGAIIYEHTDSVGYGSGYGSHRITANECKINY